jgi:predicted amidohydrolase
MFATGFSMNAAAVREGLPSETEQFLGGLAAEHELFIMGGLAVAEPSGQTRNQAVVFSPSGQLLARYNKIHLFTPAGEAEHYAPGTELVTFSWNRCVVAPLICYDLRFPELFRGALDRAVQLFAVIANWPVKREAHWVTLLQARAIENQAYVAGVNRCGADPKYAYPGHSLIVDPQGKILAELGNREGVIQAEADLGALEDWRNEFPALKDRRRTPV